MYKKRILMVGEASFLKTGYSTYIMELFKRLYKANKYELAELGCFGRIEDHKMPWKFYSNLPDINSEEENRRYNLSQYNTFGVWKFEETLLDFRPDIVIDIRDPYVFDFEEKSPFREYFHWLIMPTVDSIPQKPEWISTFMDADGVLTYSDWGLSVLKECNGLIKVISSAPPGADLEIFKPVVNKAEHKRNCGVPEDSFIIGTIMRNQKRKLFPDLIKSFRMFLDKAPEDIAKRSYLYMHTSYPDWWDVAELILENGVSHRCLFTYKCQDCNHVFQ